jgi:hypothetical protein
MVLIVEADPSIGFEIQTTFERAGAAAVAVRTIQQARLIEQDGLSAAVLGLGLCETMLPSSYVIG